MQYVIFFITHLADFFYYYSDNKTDKTATIATQTPNKNFCASQVHQCSTISQLLAIYHFEVSF